MRSTNVLFIIAVLIACLTCQGQPQAESCLTRITQVLQVCIPDGSQPNVSDTYAQGISQYRNFIQAQIGLTGESVFAQNKTYNASINGDKPFQIAQCTCPQVNELTLGLDVPQKDVNDSSRVLSSFFDSQLPKYLEPQYLNCSQYNDPTPAAGPCLPTNKDCQDLLSQLQKYNASTFATILDFVNSDAKNLGGTVTIFAPTDLAYSNLLKTYNITDSSKVPGSLNITFAKIAMNHIILDVVKEVVPMANGTTLLSAISQTPSEQFQCNKRGYLTINKGNQKRPDAIVSSGSSANITWEDIPLCRNISLNIIDQYLLPCPVAGGVNNTDILRKISTKAINENTLQNLVNSPDCSAQDLIFICAYNGRNYTYSRSELFQLINCVNGSAQDTCLYDGVKLKSNDINLQIVQNGACTSKCISKVGTPSGNSKPVNLNTPSDYITSSEPSPYSKSQTSTSQNYQQTGSQQLSDRLLVSENCLQGLQLVSSCTFNGSFMAFEKVVDAAYGQCAVLDPIPKNCQKFMEQKVGQLGYSLNNYLLTNCTTQCISSQEYADYNVNKSLSQQALNPALQSEIAPQASASSVVSNQVDPRRLYSLIVNGSQYDVQFAEASECSKTCGGGYSQIEPYCYSKQTGLLEPLVKCGGNLTAEVLNLMVSDCNTQPCVGVNWTVGEWSSCSDQCGSSNVQTRTVQCTNFTSNLKADIGMCNGNYKPNDIRNCANKSCSSVMWTTGDWGNCVSGKKQRRVGCQYINGTTTTTELCQERLQYNRPQSAVCYDHIQSNPKQCPDKFTGFNCQIFKGICKSVNLKPGQVCCSSGVVSRNGQCCQTGIADNDGNCCEVGSQGQIPYIDSQGFCCSKQLDYAGTCGGGSTQIDILGEFCQGSIDASGICCPTIDYLDDLGVCNGNNSDGIFVLRVRTNPSKLKNSSIPGGQLSPNYIKSQLRRALQTYDYMVQDISVVPYGGDITFYEARFSGPLNRSLDYAQLYSIYDLQISKNADLASVEKYYRPNNGICEVGEFNATDSDDCKQFSQVIKAEVQVSCGIGGVYVKGTSTCACFVGYQGQRCQNCSAGYMRVNSQCIFDALGVRQLSSSYKSRQEKGMIAGITIGVGLFMILVVVLAVVACCCCKRRQNKSLFDSGAAKPQKAASQGGSSWFGLRGRAGGYKKGQLDGGANKNGGTRQLPLSTNAKVDDDYERDVLSNQANGNRRRGYGGYDPNNVGNKNGDEAELGRQGNNRSNGNKLQQVLSAGNNNQNQTSKNGFQDDDQLINFHDVDDLDRQDSAAPANGIKKPDMWIQNTSFNNAAAQRTKL